MNTPIRHGTLRRNHLLASLAVLSCALPMLAPATAQAQGNPKTAVIKEDWDWAGPMAKVVKQGKGKNVEGVVLQLGDSLSYANQSTKWAFSGAPDGTAEDKATLVWSHAGKRDNTDGWYLARMDHPAGGRSETAASGIRTDEYIAGGKRGMPPLKAILEKFKPQVAFVLLGANDATASRPVEAVAKDMATIVDTILANGTVPVLQLVPPGANDARNEFIRKYNEAFVTLARAKKIPMVDLYGEFVTRAPNNWKTKLISGDGIHFTGEQAGGPATPENLAQCGYLLRCWAAVQKLTEVKTKVIDLAK
ncbi:MAG: SGNH/GDSL hydrolase family protein [bacterium]